MGRPRGSRTHDVFGMVHQPGADGAGRPGNPLARPALVPQGFDRCARRDRRRSMAPVRAGGAHEPTGSLCAPDSFDSMACGLGLIPALPALAPRGDRSVLAPARRQRSFPRRRGVPRSISWVLLRSPKVSNAAAASDSATGTEGTICRTLTARFAICQFGHPLRPGCPRAAQSLRSAATASFEPFTALANRHRQSAAARACHVVYGRRRRFGP